MSSIHLNFYSRSAEVLMQESGCRLDHPAAAKFCQHVMDGEWNKVFTIKDNEFIHFSKQLFFHVLRLKWI